MSSKKDAQYYTITHIGPMTRENNWTLVTDEIHLSLRNNWLFSNNWGLENHTIPPISQKEKTNQCEPCNHSVLGRLINSCPKNLPGHWIGSHTIWKPGFDFSSFVGLFEIFLFFLPLLCDLARLSRPSTHEPLEKGPTPSFHSFRTRHPIIT